MGQLIERADAAAIAGVAPGTFSSYVHRGQAPAPVEWVGRTPRWDEDEVRAWQQQRPGRVGRPSTRGPSPKGTS